MRSLKTSGVAAPVTNSAASKITGAAAEAVELIEAALGRVVAVGDAHVPLAEDRGGVAEVLQVVADGFEVGR